MEGSLVSRIWSVRIQGMDISMGNWMRRPMVSSRKNSRNQSCDRSQHCWRASENQLRQFHDLFKKPLQQYSIKEALHKTKWYASLYMYSFWSLKYWLEYCVFFVWVWKWFLTTEVEEMGVEERVLMKVLYGLNYRAIQAAAQGLLRATFVCDQRLEHGSHHVQLQRDKIF